MRHAEGDGVPQDPVEAYKWLSLAAAQGIADATEARNALQKKLTREQIKEGQRRVDAFAVKPRSQ
jgi:TPR repeat protein